MALSKQESQRIRQLSEELEQAVAKREAAQDFYRRAYAELHDYVRSLEEAR